MICVSILLLGQFLININIVLMYVYNILFMIRIKAKKCCFVNTLLNGRLWLNKMLFLTHKYSCIQIKNKTLGKQSKQGVKKLQCLRSSLSYNTLTYCMCFCSGMYTLSVYYFCYLFVRIFLVLYLCYLCNRSNIDVLRCSIIVGIKTLK